MSDDTINIHLVFALAIAEEEHTNSAALAVAELNRGFIVSNAVSTSLSHHLGVRDMDSNDAELLEKTREIFEERVYSAYISALEEESKAHPKLLRTEKPREEVLELDQLTQ